VAIVVTYSLGPDMLRALIGISMLVLLATPVVGAESTAWIAAARILRNQEPSGSGVYLRPGFVITAAHLTDPNTAMSVGVGGMVLPAQVLKQGVFDDVDLTLLKIDDERIAGRNLPQMQLCTAPPWPGDPVIVVDAERASRSRIVGPQVLPFSFRTKFTTLIADVATTGNSGSGVFDPDRKCLHGIMSRKFMTGGKDVAKYFVPAAEIRTFIPDELRSLF
jgi:hypothetical protein